MGMVKGKVLLVALVGGLLLGQTTVTAKEIPGRVEKDKYQISGDYIVDEEGYRYSEFVSASGEEVSIEDALIILNSEEDTAKEVLFINKSQDKAMNTYGLAGPDLGFTISSIQTNYVGSESRVTPEIIGPGTISQTVSTTVSSSITSSASISASLKANIFAEVKLESGVAISNTVAQTNSYSVSFPVDSGKRGAIYFKPYCVRATGRANNEGFVAIYPKLINGWADGVFYLKQR